MNSQLSLLAPPRPQTMPLRDALSLVANQWSHRLGVGVRVVEEPHVGGSGYRIERTT